MNQANLDPESERPQSASNAGGQEELASAAFSSLSPEARLEKLNDIMARNDIDAFFANIVMFIDESRRNEDFRDAFQEYSGRAMTELAEYNPEKLIALLTSL